MSGAKTGMPPLLDRQAELTALARAVDGVAAGEGHVVLITGQPGAGKTRLLAEARALCDRAGLRVLVARGGELEREYPFGVVRQLFEAALLEGEGARWLEGPAVTASSVFRPAAASEAAAFATLNGLYWMTVNAAAAGAPLALLVDDLHWADPPSAGFLQFLVRRLEGLPILLLVAGRPVDTDVLADIAAGRATTVLRPAPLSQDSAVRLTGELLGVRPSERFVRACREATGGSPLLLVELLRALRAEGVVPDDAHVGEIEEVGPSAIARIGLVRLRRLPAETVAVAQALAVLGMGADASLLAALAKVDGPVVTRAIESLVEAEVVDAQLPLGFVHPIVRDAIYHELAPDVRDQRHARAAEILNERAAEPDRVGSHLLLAAPRGERWIVDALQAAAADAAHRGALETTITFLRRALAERPADADADLLFRLGMTEATIDPGAAVTHLRAARRATADARTQARTGEMIARMLAFFDPSEAVQAARQTRAELPEDSEDLRAALLAIEHHAGRFSDLDAEPYPDRVPDSPRGRMLTAVQAWDLALGGGTAAECAALAGSVLGLDGASGTRPPLTQDSIFTAMVAGAVLVLADDRRAEGFWERWHRDAVRGGRAHAVIAGGVWHGLMRFRLGRLDDAELAIRGAMEGPSSWGPGTETIPAHTLATLADVLTERGDLDGAEAALDMVPQRLGPDTEGALLTRCARLRLLVARGEPQAGLDAVEDVLERLQTVRNPAWAPWRSLRAEALAQLGRTDAAIAAATEELELARHWGTPAPIGRALRLLGVIEDRVDLLEEAVATTRDPFACLEQAKALLALGQAVRRLKRPTEARAHLRDAHELAARCGAQALARRARDELAIAGGRPRATAGSGAQTLTPSERRVAELAAAGHRNRDIAQQLYLSPKTVEVHLSGAYRKLGIRTRGELAGAMSPAVTVAARLADGDGGE